MSRGRRVLIVGCGYVGVALGKHLARVGFRVAGLRRNTAGLPEEIEPLAADLLDRQTLSQLPASWDHVVYLTSASGRTPEAYRDAYVSGLANLLDVLSSKGHGTERLLYVSSTGVYTETDGSWVDEDTPVGPLCGPEKFLVEGETLAGQSPFPSVVIRFGGIYGPGRCRLIDRIRAGDIAAAGSTVYTNRIHREDCARVLHHLMELDAPDPLYIAVDNEPVQLDRIVAWLASEMSVSLPAQRDAAQPLRSGKNKRCRNRRLRRSGYEFRYPSFREGYGALLKDSEQRGGA